MLRLTALAAVAASAVRAMPTEHNLSTRSQTLDWTPCTISFPERLFSSPPFPYECATLAVPFDYTDGDSTEGLDLDLVRVKAQNDTNQGSIVFNPGGPGGSGIEFVVWSSDILHEILGGGFDLIAFDPRGTGQTIPFDCNQTYTPMTKRDDTTVVQNMTELVFDKWDEHKEFAEACKAQMGRNGTVVGTTFTARDMAIIADALDEDGLLNYWGVSYGTYLGTMFATLYPDKVGKIMLDGNVNPHAWRAGSMTGAVQDADKAFLGFLSECVADPERCSLAELGDAEELRQIFNSVADVSPESYQALKLFMGLSLYTPETWPTLASIFVELLNNSDATTSLVNTSARVELPTYNQGVDALYGIYCSDSVWRASSPEDMLPVIAKQQNVSSFADMWYPRASWPCTQWNITPAESYAGEFGGKTFHPMLIANGIYDPVTPISAARNVSAAFEGSVLLQHNGYGHGVTAHPSLCTGRVIRRFFETGELPNEGTVCEPEVGPFELNGNLEAALADSPARKRSERGGASIKDEARLLQAMRELGRRQNELEKRTLLA